MAAQKFPDLPKTLGKEGAFSFSAETFVDAFDHTAYKETVWNFSEAREENSIDGLELHGWGARSDLANLKQNRRQNQKIRASLSNYFFNDKFFKSKRLSSALDNACFLLFFISLFG